MIRVERLCKTYGRTEALRSVSFEVPAGQVCGYIGPNGAGKTTTVRVLTGVLRPTAGRVSVAGFDVADDPLEVKRRIGYVAESGAVYATLTVNEYLALVGALHHMQPAEVAVRCGRMLRLFQIDEVADRRLDTLSKGMRQKVVLSAAILHDPDVLLLDEPLTGLDANAAATVKDVIRGLADRGKAILYCSHMLDVVERLCDRVIVLDRGEVVADGSIAELISSPRGETLERAFRRLTRGKDDRQTAEALLDVVGGGPSREIDLSDFPDLSDAATDPHGPQTRNGPG